MPPRVDPDKLGSEPQRRLSFASAPRRHVTMLRLEAFGGLSLTNGRAERPQPRRRIALFARLAAAGARGVSRDELLALFWPERDIESARHSLDQLLYEARRDLGASPSRGTGTLRLDADVITCDVAEWSAALERDDLTTAVALYRGPLLQGFHLNGSAEFERWVDAARARLAAEHRTVLETLATRALAEGNADRAVAWWRLLVAEDRFSARMALGLMRALVEAGDRGGALEFARLHERIMRVELECAPDPAVSAFVDAMRAEAPRPSTPHLAVLAATDSAALPPASTPAAPVGVHTALPASRAGRGVRSRRTIVPMRAIVGVVATTSLALITAYAVTSRHRPDTNAATHSTSMYLPTKASTAALRSRRRRYETTNIAAHDLFERGRDPRLLRSTPGQRNAVEYLRQAVSLDTNYAAAYAMLASRYATVAWATPLPITERRAMLARAEAAARRAIALDDSLADAHTALGYTLSVDYDATASLAELERATALDPSSAEAQEMLAKAYELVGRPADALAAAQNAVSSDPLSATANAELGDALYFARRYDEALTQLTKLTALEPPLQRVPEYLAEVYGATGRWSDAITVLRPIGPRARQWRGLLGYALARSGQRAEARRMLEQMLQEESAGLAPAVAIAEVYAGLRERERAFVWLERSIDDHSLAPRIMGPLFDELRADARFEHLRHRLGINRQVASAAIEVR